MARRFRKGIYTVYEESYKQRKARMREYWILAGAVAALVSVEHIIKALTSLLAHILP